MKQFDAIITLRRDNDYNYAKVKHSFIPANGEICLVDTARSGLRAVCGDGKTPFGELEYIDQLIIKGYYANDKFYKDLNRQEPITSLEDKLYIDSLTYSMYLYDGEKFHQISGTVTATAATPTTPGVMKLYSTTGQNEDGTMTQKAITDELNEKVEVEIDVEQELIIFTND